MWLRASCKLASPSSRAQMITTGSVDVSQTRDFFESAWPSSKFSFVRGSLAHISSSARGDRLDPVFPPRVPQQPRAINSQTLHPDIRGFGGGNAVVHSSLDGFVCAFKRDDDLDGKQFSCGRSAQRNFFSILTLGCIKFRACNHRLRLRRRDTWTKPARRRRKSRGNLEETCKSRASRARR